MNARSQTNQRRHNLPTESVAEVLSRISPKRQQSIRRVLEHPREYVLLSVRSLAQTLKLDPSTLLRTVLAMGFSEYKHFQWYLHELSVAHATSLDLTGDVVVTKRSAEAQLKEAIRQDQENLRTLYHGLDLKRASTLAARFYSARRTAIFGGDAAEPLVRYLEYQLTVLGLPTVAALSPGSTFHVSRSLGKNDLVVAISFRRGIRQTVEGLQKGRAAGAYCIGVTDSSVSPIARFSNEFFLASTDSPFGTSYTAPMSLFNALVSAIAFHRPRRTMVLLRELDKEQRTGYRWYHEE